MDNQFITRDMLELLDIDLSDQDVDALLEHLNETLQERVSAEITESLTEEQIKDLVTLQETGSDDDLTAWLDTNVPDMQKIVENEIDTLISEITEEEEDDDNEDEDEDEGKAVEDK